MTITISRANGPDLDQSMYSDGEIRPSWVRPDLHVDAGHRSIFERTDNIPGWQLPGDTYKLYEMGHYCGDVILEIGTFGGRSAVVAVEGALSNPKHRLPCFFSIDIHPAYVQRGYDSLAARGLDRYGAFFLGGLGPFIEEFSISPTMVFVDGDHRYPGIKSDLALLARYLQPGVPVLCHDYLNPDNGKPEIGVRQAVDEWVRDGFARSMGSFGCSALLITTEKCTGKSHDGPEASLAKLQAKTKRGRFTRMMPGADRTVRHWVASNVPFARRIWRRLKGLSYLLPQLMRTIDYESPLSRRQMRLAKGTFDATQ